MANSSTDARNKAQDAAGKAQDAAGKALDAGQTAAGAVADRAREMSGAVADRAREVSGEALRAGQHAAHAVGNAAENATSRVGEGIQSLAQSVRQHTPDSGVLGSAADTVANTLEQGGRYIQSEGLSGMTDDLSTLIKRNPIPALLVGIGVGFLLARVTSRS